MHLQRAQRGNIHLYRWNSCSWRRNQLRPNQQPYLPKLGARWTPNPCCWSIFFCLQAYVIIVETSNSVQFVRCTVSDETVKIYRHPHLQSLVVSCLLSFELLPPVHFLLPPSLLHHWQGQCSQCESCEADPAISIDCSAQEAAHAHSGWPWQHLQKLDRNLPGDLTGHLGRGLGRQSNDTSGTWRSDEATHQCTPHGNCEHKGGHEPAIAQQGSKLTSAPLRFDKPTCQNGTFMWNLWLA